MFLYLWLYQVKYSHFIPHGVRPGAWSPPSRHRSAPCGRVSLLWKTSWIQRQDHPATNPHWAQDPCSTHPGFFTQTQPKPIDWRRGRCRQGGIAFKVFTVTSNKAVNVHSNRRHIASSISLACSIRNAIKTSVAAKVNSQPQNHTFVDITSDTDCDMIRLSQTLEVRFHCQHLPFPVIC